ncbi:MAG: hypothetical protein JXB08_01175 [Bacilli bacterium]|nr:hypothetical protein [Bacilli bacterium]
MEDIIREYNQWLKDNQHFILHLRNHDSSLYTRISPIYEVLNHIKEEYDDNNLESDDDIWKIFQVGLEYLHSQIDTCKLYLENAFKNDFHTFLEYDNVVGYLLYMEDLRYELEENQISYNKIVMDNLIEFLEEIMMDRGEISDNLNLYVDSEVHKIADMTNLDFQSIIDIFIQIAETLGIELFIENDYVVGKDI